MKFESNKIQMQPEILKRLLGGELLAPITITEFTNGVCKAGTPINADGEVAETDSGSNDAIGILLNDVTEDNPNGSLIKAFAVINEDVAEAHSGVTYDATLKATLSQIVFE